jgi:hypothetical protein
MKFHTSGQEQDMNQPPETAPHPAPRSFWRRLAAIRPNDIVLLLVLCVFVGLVLAVFNVDPATLWVDFFGAVAEAWSSFFHAIGSWLRWALQYFFLGAVIVLPIWLVWHILKAVMRR